MKFYNLIMILFIGCANLAFVQDQALIEQQFEQESSLDDYLTSADGFDDVVIQDNCEYGETCVCGICCCNSCITCCNCECGCFDDLYCNECNCECGLDSSDGFCNTCSGACGSCDGAGFECESGYDCENGTCYLTDTQCPCGVASCDTCAPCDCECGSDGVTCNTCSGACGSCDGAGFECASGLDCVNSVCYVECGSEGNETCSICNGADGALCSSNDDCDSGNCYDGICEACIGNCNGIICYDSGQCCDSGSCINGFCSNGGDGCTCDSNSDCSSGNCYAGLCESCLGTLAPCSDDSNCCSGSCIDYFCSCGSGDGCTCDSNSDCASGNCYLGFCSPCIIPAPSGGDSWAANEYEGWQNANDGSVSPYCENVGQCCHCLEINGTQHCTNEEFISCQDSMCVIDTSAIQSDVTNVQNKGDNAEST
ncbi:MAG: hypothetical protein ACXWL5_04195, partial [Candidatus Chromulinivorax sp.]